MRRLAFIKRARQLGFPIEAIRTLLDLSDHPERPCDDANTLAREQLSAVETKIVQLEALRSELGRMVASGCDGNAGDCRVIDALASQDLLAAGSAHGEGAHTLGRSWDGVDDGKLGGDRRS